MRFRSDARRSETSRWRWNCWHRHASDSLRICSTAVSAEEGIAVCIKSVHRSVDSEDRVVIAALAVFCLVINAWSHRPPPLRCLSCAGSWSYHPLRSRGRTQHRRKEKSVFRCVGHHWSASARLTSQLSSIGNKGKKPLLSVRFLKSKNGCSRVPWRHS